MDKVGQLSLPIDGFTSITYGVGQRSRPAAEHTNFANLQKKVNDQYVCSNNNGNHDEAHVAVLFLHKFEERGHIRPSEVVDSLQSGEHASTLEPLEVIFANILEESKI